MARTDATTQGSTGAAAGASGSNDSAAQDEKATGAQGDATQDELAAPLDAGVHICIVVLHLALSTHGASSDLLIHADARPM